MLLARVEGHVIATRKHPSFAGWRLLVCQPINNAGVAQASPIVAIDSLGAGLRQRVIISSDGAAARIAVGDRKSPARWMTIGIVDETEAVQAKNLPRERGEIGAPSSTRLSRKNPAASRLQAGAPTSLSRAESKSGGPA